MFNSAQAQIQKELKKDDQKPSEIFIDEGLAASLLARAFAPIGVKDFTLKEAEYLEAVVKLLSDQPSSDKAKQIRALFQYAIEAEKERYRNFWRQDQKFNLSELKEPIKLRLKAIDSIRKSFENDDDFLRLRRLYPKDKLPLIIENTPFVGGNDYASLFSELNLIDLLVSALFDNSENPELILSLLNQVITEPNPEKISQALRNSGLRQDVQKNVKQLHAYLFDLPSERGYFGYVSTETKSNPPATQYLLTQVLGSGIYKIVVRADGETKTLPVSDGAISSTQQLLKSYLKEHANAYEAAGIVHGALTGKGKYAMDNSLSRKKLKKIKSAANALLESKSSALLEPKSSDEPLPTAVIDELSYFPKKEISMYSAIVPVHIKNLKEFFTTFLLNNASVGQNAFLQWWQIIEKIIPAEDLKQFIIINKDEKEPHLKELNLENIAMDKFEAYLKTKKISVLKSENETDANYGARISVLLESKSFIAALDQQQREIFIFIDGAVQKVLQYPGVLKDPEHLNEMRTQCSELLEELCDTRNSSKDFSFNFNKLKEKIGMPALLILLNEINLIGYGVIPNVETRKFIIDELYNFAKNTPPKSQESQIETKEDKLSHDAYAAFSDLMTKADPKTGERLFDHTIKKYAPDGFSQKDYDAMREYKKTLISVMDPRILADAVKRKDFFWYSYLFGVILKQLHTPELILSAFKGNDNQQLWPERHQNPREWFTKNLKEFIAHSDADTLFQLLKGWGLLKRIAQVVPDDFEFVLEKLGEHLSLGQLVELIDDANISSVIVNSNLLAAVTAVLIRFASAKAKEEKEEKEGKKGELPQSGDEAQQKKQQQALERILTSTVEGRTMFGYLLNNKTKEERIITMDALTKVMSPEGLVNALKSAKWFWADFSLKIIVESLKEPKLIFAALEDANFLWDKERDRTWFRNNLAILSKAFEQDRELLVQYLKGKNFLKQVVGEPLEDFAFILAELNKYLTPGQLVELIAHAKILPGLASQNNLRLKPITDILYQFAQTELKEGKEIDSQEPDEKGTQQTLSSATATFEQLLTTKNWNNKTLFSLINWDDKTALIKTITSIKTIPDAEIVNVLKQLNCSWTASELTQIINRLKDPKLIVEALGLSRKLSIKQGIEHFKQNLAALASVTAKLPDKEIFSKLLQRSYVVESFQEASVEEKQFLLRALRDYLTPEQLLTLIDQASVGVLTSFLRDQRLIQCLEEVISPDETLISALKKSTWSWSANNLELIFYTLKKPQLIIEVLKAKPDQGIIWDQKEGERYRDKHIWFKAKLAVLARALDRESLMQLLKDWNLLKKVAQGSPQDLKFVLENLRQHFEPKQLAELIEHAAILPRIKEVVQTADEDFKFILNTLKSYLTLSQWLSLMDESQTVTNIISRGDFAKLLPIIKVFGAMKTSLASLESEGKAAGTGLEHETKYTDANLQLLSKCDSTKEASNYLKDPKNSKFFKDSMLTLSALPNGNGYEILMRLFSNMTDEQIVEKFPPNDSPQQIFDCLNQVLMQEHPDLKMPFFALFWKNDAGLANRLRIIRSIRAQLSPSPPVDYYRIGKIILLCLVFVGGLVLLAGGITTLLGVAIVTMTAKVALGSLVLGGFGVLFPFLVPLISWIANRGTDKSAEVKGKGCSHDWDASPPLRVSLEDSDFMFDSSKSREILYEVAQEGVSAKVPKAEILTGAESENEASENLTGERSNGTGAPALVITETGTPGIKVK